MVLLAVASLCSAAPAGADDGTGNSSSFYSVAAHSSPIGVEFYDTGAPLIPGEIVYGSLTVTKAELDSVGNSAGFAAGPYLGDNVPALMGAANALGPQGAILPTYPFMVATQFPGNPKATQESGPRRLVANSGEHGSDGDAHIGLARGNPALASLASTSAVKHDPATGLLTAKADGMIQGFSVGPTLSIGQLITHAEVTGRAGEAPQKRTSLSIGSLTVMGTLVGLTDKGLAPVPGTPKTADLNSLTGQLAAAGIILGLLPGAETDSGIDSAALMIGITRDVPGHGTMRVRIILGRVRAKVESSSG